MRLRPEGLHFSMDVFASLGVFAALLLMKLGAAPAWDIVISALVSGYVIKESAGLLASSVQDLMDRSLAGEVNAEIERIIQTHHPSVSGFHELRTRRAGLRYFVDFHVELAGVERFEDAHEIAEGLIDKIKARIPNADVTVHYDPKGGR